MKTDVTGQQIDSYTSNGFLAIEDFLDSRELDTWRSVTEEAVTERLGGRPLVINQSDPTDYYATVFTQCLRLTDTHPGMAKLMMNPELGRVAAKLAGVDGIRIWHDQAVIKPAFGNPTAFHLDNPYWSFTSRDSISIWVALDDVTPSNGCMWYVPATHKTARSENVSIGQNPGDLFRVYPEWTKIDPVPVPAKAGTAIFHNGLTAHGAGANMTNKPRRAMTCAYMPDGCTFNGTQNILPDAYFKSLRIGDRLDDPTQNPLVWKRAI